MSSPPNEGVLNDVAFTPIGLLNNKLVVTDGTGRLVGDGDRIRSRKQVLEHRTQAGVPAARAIRPTTFWKATCAEWRACFSVNVVRRFTAAADFDIDQI
jgi:hypothetical protein